MQVDLTDRTAIVTGAGRGIGEEIARQLAESGANVVAAARTESEIEATAERCEEYGVGAIAVPTDLRSVPDIDELVDEAVEAFGPPEILVNDAAAHVAGGVFETTVEEVDRMTEVNFRGPLLLSQRVAAELVEADAGGGRIVNISSIVGAVGLRGMAVYCGTKAGLYGLTRALAAEFAPHDITVNSISPGFTRVARIERLIEEKGHLYNLDGIPLDRLGEPEDVANAVRFLSSDEAAYITGVDLPVDGGVKMTAALYPYD